MATKDKDKKKESPKGFEAVLDAIRKEYGDGAVMNGNTIVANVEAIPTGSLSLDLALGIGGVPKGRVIEVYGPEASGKTTLCLEIVANVQQAGGRAVYIDAEHALDLQYAKNGIGVDVDKLLLSQPSSGEEAFGIARMWAESGEVELIVVDSVAALVPKAELEGAIGDPVMGAQARLMSQGLRVLSGITAKSKTTVIFINQLREKIGVMFGNPETTPGGKALKYYASVRIDIRKIGNSEKKNDKGESLGNRVKTKVVKNKVGPPARVAEFDIIYGEGIDHISAALEAAEALEVVKRSGSSYKFADKSFAGKEKLLQFLKDNPLLADKLRNEVLAKAKPATVIEPLIVADEDAEKDELALEE